MRCRQFAFGAQRMRDLGERRRPRIDVAQATRNADRIGLDPKDSAKMRKPRGTRIVQPAHVDRADDQRPIARVLSAERRCEAGLDCG